MLKKTVKMLFCGLKMDNYIDICTWKEMEEEGFQNARTL